MKKHILILFSLSIFSFSLSAQNTDLNQIAIYTYLPSNLNIPSEAAKLLENKLTQISTNYGLGGRNISNKFIITANIQVLSKDVLPGPPPMISQKIEITIYIGDADKNILFSSINMKTIGIGQNENKAFINALKDIPTQNTALEGFVNNGKSRIVDYYNSQCNEIIVNAQTLSNQNKYDEAIYNLVTVPNVCNECFIKAKTEIKSIFEKKINFECDNKLKQANVIWAQAHDKSNINRVTNILLGINPNAKCISEVTNFFSQIQNEITEKDKAEWNFKVRQYELEAAKEKELIISARENAKIDFELEKIKTASYEKIAVEYARNQPKVINKTSYFHTHNWLYY